MKYKLVVTFFLLSCAPVQAGCHKYSRWYYPYPQRCYIAEVYKPKLEVKFVPEEPVSLELPGALSYLHFSNKQVFPSVVIPTEMICPYTDERAKALCLIKIEVEKKNGGEPHK
jgi:hypothetical protein